jgi:light-regulated signal transduction histidine kinase (bacteriophytochrome)
MICKARTRAMANNTTASAKHIPAEAWPQAEVDRLQRSNAHLEESNANLARSNHDFERFVFVVSHDLQERIRVMTTYAELLEAKSSGLDEETKFLVSSILTSAARMREMLTGLIAHAQAGRPPAGAPKIVDLNNVLEIVKANLKVSISETGAVVTSDHLPILNVHSSDFISLFQNLIANAIKYQGGEPPQVHVSARPGEGQILFSVSDNGVGIDPKYHQQIFEPFRRLHGSDVPGTGLGLAICQRVIERYEGRIWVESEPGHGATFLFTLPLAGEPG